MIGRGVVLLALAIPLAGAVADARVMARCEQAERLRFFGDRTVVVPLLVHAPDHRGLAVRAELVQLTARLSVSTGKSIEAPLGASNEIDLSVPLPAVKREVGFELRFRSRRGDEAEWRPAGHIALRVYPSDLLAPLREWAESHSLRVEDGRGALTEFLHQEGIRIAGDRKKADVVLYVGERELSNRAQSVVRFAERQMELPHLLVERSTDGTAVTVEMRLLDRLATDPGAQKIFLEVFRLLHEESPPTIGDFQ